MTDSKSINQDIIFKIGTIGAAKATSQILGFNKSLLAAGASLAVIGKKLSDAIDSAQKFGQVFRANSTDMSLFNRDTAGLIDTTQALTKAVEFQEAGLRLTAEQMRAIGVAAADYAQNTGKNATDAFNLLTKSVITARETGLVQFGVELSQTADKTLAQKEALEKLIEKTKGITLETESAEEAVARFNNTFGTIKDLEINAFLNAAERAFVGLATSVVGGISNLEEYENQVHATNGAILDWKWTTEGFTNTLMRNLDTIVQVAGVAGGPVAGVMGQIISSQEWLADAVNDANKEYEQQIELMTKQAQLIRELEGQRASEQKRISNEKEYLAWTKRYSDAHTKLASSLSGDREEQIRAKSEFYKILSQQPEVPGAFSAAGIKTVVPELEREFFEPRLKKSGGGRGKSWIDSKDTLSEFSLEEIDEYNRIRTPYTGLGEVSTRGQYEAMGPTGRGSSAIEAQAEAEKKARQDADERALSEQKKKDEEEIKAIEEAEKRKLEIRKYFMGEEKRLRDMDSQERYQAAVDSGEMSINFLKNLGAAQDVETKKGFERQKKFEYAANMTQTFLSATAAFRSVMQSGVPFPANVGVAAALAGSVLAAGARRGNKIRTQSFSGGSTGTDVSIGSNMGGSDLSSTGDQNRNYTFNLMLSGQTIHSEMVNENDLQKQSGGKAFATVGG